MKNTGIVILCCIFAVLIIPVMNIKQIVTPDSSDNIIAVYNTVENRTENMNMENYVLKVLEKEMPASYEDEALKAQAIAIRTYALRKQDTEAEEHFGADVCTDYSHCMAYAYDEEEMWGNKTKEYVNKYKNAVNETKGMILTYNNEPAATFFFSVSAGKTQNCSDVWGSDIPYLRSVDSEADKTRSGYESSVEFTSEELTQKLEVDFNDDYKIDYFESGYVKSITLNGKNISGKDVRDKLGLRSSSFKIDKNDGKYKFTVYGYGHGVGMSQQGADEMAKQGKNFKEILNHYYNGTTISEL